jgi:hypothetical protein
MSSNGSILTRNLFSGTIGFNACCGGEHPIIKKQRVEEKANVFIKSVAICFVNISILLDIMTNP